MRGLSKPGRIARLAALAAAACIAGGACPEWAAARDAGADSAAVAAGTGLRTPESFYGKRRGLRTIAEIIAQNGVQTLGGRFLMAPPDNAGFVVSLESIHENLISGQEWDDNSFSANNYRHPWQGGLYFDAARANGFDFYASSMFGLAGSWLWEYTGERHHPSYNDMVNTHIGGIVFGEVLYRLSSMLLDNTATGSERAWRELGAFAISPVRGFNRMFTGEAFQVHANPADRMPSVHGVGFQFGIRTLGDETLWDSATGRVFLGIEAQYGDRFTDLKKPFDNFNFGLQVNAKNTPHGLGRILMHGMLGGTTLNDNPDRQQVLGAYQDLDYIDNEAYTYGGQSFGVGYLTRFVANERTKVRTGVFLNGILLGATKSDYASVSGREYDYGPGAGAKFVVAFSRDGYEVFTLAHESYWIHSVSGTAMNSVVTFTTVRASIPLQAWNAIGVDYILYNAERDYELYPHVSTRNPELRAYLSWRID